MLEYDFAKAIYEPVKVYREFPLPVLLCDRDFTVHWSNDLAKERFGGLARPTGLQDILREYDVHDILSQLEERGNCLLSEIFPLDDLCLNLSPIVYQQEIAAVAVLCLPQEWVSGVGVRRSANLPEMPQAVAGGIREAAGGLFEALDAMEARVEMMDAGWLKPSQGRLNAESYGILRIASNLSDYARYRRGDEFGSLRPTVVNLQELLQRARPVVEELCSTENLEIRFQVDGGIAHVPLDIRIFETAFYNLLHNSLIYSGDKNTITVRLDQAGRYVALRIEDKGLGIPSQMQEEVLRPFITFRHSSRKIGVGLGLPLAKLAAELHGGSLRLESREGEGTAVTMLFPATTFSQQIPFGQAHGPQLSAGRFSAAYVGLLDAVHPPV